MKSLPINKLQQLSKNNHLPHAWIFLATSIDFGLQQAKSFAKWLLCTNQQEMNACGTCRACSLLAAGVHPDYLYITNNDKNIIQIEDIRRVVDFSTAQAQIAKQKIVLISPGEAMHYQSANALLKTLEEPPSDTIYILICKNQELLPKTIISRCHILNLYEQAIVTEDIAVELSELYGDLENLWLRKVCTVSQTVERWLKKWPDMILDRLYIVVTDAIRYKYTQNMSLGKNNSESQKKLAKSIPVDKFWTILERLQQAQLLIGRNNRPNMQLLLEDMLLI